jgi:hypothetical protein
MTSSKDLINNFMDLNCIVEWEECKTLEEMNYLEDLRIKSNYPVLNFQNTLEIFNKNHRFILTSSKNRMRF